MKHSVAALACVDASASKALTRPGSAFFISNRGRFLTAAHVLLDMRRDEDACPVSAVVLPADDWDPRAREEIQVWFPFRIPDCQIDTDLYVAACSPADDLSVPKPWFRFRISPVRLEFGIPADGTRVAFTAFPLGTRDPMTFMAEVAAYRTQWQNERSLPELVLDRGTWPGSSGSPVYLPDGSVVGILIKFGNEDGTGLTYIRPIASVERIIAEQRE